MKLKVRNTICNILQRLDLISDWVVEQGTSDIWTYRKWNSGIAECWGTKRGSVPSGWSQTGIAISFPFTFRNIEAFSVQQQNYQIERCYLGDQTMSGATIQTKSDGAATIYFRIYVIGFWKAFSGGVLRNPVIARLTAIFTSLLFGGDVNEDETETSPDKDTGKSSKTGNDNRHYHLIRGVAHTQCLPEQAINGDVQKRGTCNDDIQARCLISHGRSHRIGVDIRSVCKSGCNYNGLDNWLTISERRWAA